LAKYKQQLEHHQVNNKSASTEHYNVNIRFDTITLEADQSTGFLLSSTDQRLGDRIKEFDLVHDKLMHHIILGDDLCYFAHIHPIIRHGDDDNTDFVISHTFPESGKYKFWVDFKPKGGNQTLAAFKFNVTGKPVHSLEETCR
jgi:hypothetical protein